MFSRHKQLSVHGRDQLENNEEKKNQTILHTHIQPLFIHDKEYQS